MDFSELFYRFVFPSIRRRLVEILYRDLSLTQEEVAEKTYLTQSAVSRYVKGGRGGYIKISEFKDIDRMLRRLAKRLVDEKMDEYSLQYHLARIAFKALSEGYVCPYHGKIDPELDINRCNICKELFRKYQ